MKDIKTKDDVKFFVDGFYSEVREDPLLGDVFNNKIKEDEWPVHLERMYSFWNTVLFGVSDYKGNPFSKHIDLAITDIHFDKWVSILSNVIDTHFSGVKANEVKWRAKTMGDMFKMKKQMQDHNKGLRSIM